MLKEAKPMDIKGEIFRHYKGGPFKAGEKLIFQLGMKEEATAGKIAGTRHSKKTTVFLLAGVLILVAFVLSPLSRGMKS
jgi:hypothetical protein